MRTAANKYTEAQYYWGVDCGSSEIKVVLCDRDGRVLQSKKQKTLFPLYKHVHSALNGRDYSPFIANETTTQFNLPPDSRHKIKSAHKIIATGYGRHHLDFASIKLTEIKAHFLGVQGQLELHKPYTIIDIGGQDAKIICIDSARVDQFTINRKCAAGTGAFIEELAHRLEVPMDRMTSMARQKDKELSLNSYCTVFSGQEVIKILMNGERVENLIFALYTSVVKRVLEMAPITNDLIVFSGGVMSFHPLLVELFASKLPEKRLIMAAEAQFCGAFGAALYGIAEDKKNGL